MTTEGIPFFPPDPDFPLPQVRATSRDIDESKPCIQVSLAVYTNPKVFQASTNYRQYSIIRDGKDIGMIWFKNILGGWRIHFTGEIDDEWTVRGVIDSVMKLKQVLQEKGITI